MTNQLDVGGIETNLRLLTAELTARGHNVAVAARPGTLSGQIELAGAHLVVLKAQLRRPLSVVFDANQVRRAFASFRPDVVHVMSASAAVVVAAARRGRHGRPPVIASPMGLQLSPNEAPGLVLLRAWLTALGAQRVIAVSPAIEARLRRLGIGRRRLVSGLVVGVELPDLGEARQMRALAREQLGVGPDEQLIMTIGTLKPSKSHELFVRAAAALVERGSEARFVIIGEGPVRPELEEEISRLSLTDRVLLLGERHPAADLLWAADVCVRPGVLEGFVGITVLEAQARGVPVVAFETEDVKAAIENGVSGLLVTPGDVGALADAVRSVLEEHSLAGMLARGGRETVERKFGLRAVTDRLEEMYGSVVEC